MGESTGSAAKSRAGDEPSGVRVISAVENFGRVPVGLLCNPAVSDAECRAYAWLTTWDFARTGRMFTGRAEMAESIGWSISKLDVTMRALERRGAIRRVRRGLGLANDIELLAEVASWCDSESHHGVTLDSSQDATPITRENARENASTEAPPEQEKLLDVPKPKTPRDLAFDALASVFPSATRGERQRLGMVANELLALDPRPTPETIAARARWVRAEWPEATAMALSKNWTLAGDRLHAAAGGDEPNDPQSGMERRGGRE